MMEKPVGSHRSEIISWPLGLNLILDGLVRPVALVYIFTIDSLLDQFYSLEPYRNGGRVLSLSTTTPSSRPWRGIQTILSYLRLHHIFTAHRPKHLLSASFTQSTRTEFRKDEEGTIWRIRIQVGYTSLRIDSVTRKEEKEKPIRTMIFTAISWA